MYYAASASSPGGGRARLAGRVRRRALVQIHVSNSQGGLNTVIASASEAIHFAEQRKYGLLRRFRSSQ
jgi:hypothetical protein